MSGTASDPIDLEALDAAIATADRADSTTKERVDAQRALLTKLKHLESGAESDIATHQIATTLLTQLTTSGMPAKSREISRAKSRVREIARDFACEIARNFAWRKLDTSLNFAQTGHSTGSRRIRTLYCVSRGHFDSYP